MVASIFSNMFMQGGDPAAALIARMSPAPDAAREILIQDLIDYLVAAGVWSKLDCLYVMAAHDAQAARLNWKSSNYTLSAINAPTFTIDRGYTGDGASSYLNTGYDVTLAGNVYVQNSCAVGVWCSTNVSSNTQHDTGSTRNRLNSRTATNFIQANLQSTGASNSSAATPGPTSVGHSVWSRTAVNVSRFIKNGSQLGIDNTVGSTPLVSSSTFIGAYSNGGTPANYSTRQINAAHYGSGLSVTEVFDLYTALQTYMTAVGV